MARTLGSKPRKKKQSLSSQKLTKGPLMTIKGDEFEVLLSLDKAETSKRGRRSLGSIKGKPIARELILRKPKGRKLFAVLLDDKGSIATKLFEPSFTGLPKDLADVERPILGRTVRGVRDPLTESSLINKPPPETFTAKRALIKAGFRAASVKKGTGSSRTLLIVNLGFRSNAEQQDQAERIVEEATGRRKGTVAVMNFARIGA